MELRSRKPIEADFRRRFSQLTAGQLQRLFELVGNPPDLARVPESLWKQFENERRAFLLLMLASVFAANSEQHGLDEFMRRPFADEFAQRRSDQVIPKHLQTLRSYLETPPADLARRAERLGARITRGGIVEVVEPLGIDAPDGAERLLDIERLRGDVRDAWLDRFDNAFGETATTRLVETEFTAASAGGAEFTMRVRGLTSESDLWVTRPELSDSGPCPVCAPLDRQPRSVWTRQFPDGPPTHPRCVCEISYAAIRAAVSTPAGV